jgi:hypothetical protein
MNGGRSFIMIQNNIVLAFHNDITGLVENGYTYMDAILYWCEKNNREIEQVAELVNQDQQTKHFLQQEAEELRFLKKEQRLPI